MATFCKYLYVLMKTTNEMFQAQQHYAPVHDERWQDHHKRLVQNIFDHEDTDEDGLISHDEFSGPKMQGFHDEF